MKKIFELAETFFIVFLILKLIGIIDLHWLFIFLPLLGHLVHFAIGWGYLIYFKYSNGGF